jgi:hypothetical protein
MGRVPTDHQGTPRANIEITKIEVYDNPAKLQANFAPPHEPALVN